MTALLPVRIGGQLLVYESKDYQGPYCTAATSKGGRCPTSLEYLDCGDFDEVFIEGTDTCVGARDTGHIEDECWLRQRCPKHLHTSRRGDVKPEWAFFDPERHARIVGRARLLWTPQGIVDHGGKWVPASAAPIVHEAGEDEQAGMVAVSLRTEPEPGTALYRHYDEDGRLLYIGITDDLADRTKAHTLGSSWMDFAVSSTVERHPNRNAALGAEEEAIKAEQPLFNDVHNRTPEAKTRLVEYLIVHGRADLLAPAVSRG